MLSECFGFGDIPQVFHNIKYVERQAFIFELKRDVNRGQQV